MPRLLVQLSDLHITAPGRLACGRVDTAEHLERAVQTVMRLRPSPTAVLITGDLTDSGQAAEYAQLRSLLQPLRAPVFLLPGNHDDTERLRTAFADHAYLRSGGPFVQYAVDLGGLRLVVADSVAPEAPHGELCAARLRQLEALLAQDRQTPTVLALHHPPFLSGIAHMDEIGLRNPDALAAVVLRHPQIERVLCGHLHRSTQVRWAGTIAMSAPSTAHQICMDLEAAAVGAYTLEPAGLLVHAWSHGGAIVSHVVPSGRFDGPYPFHADADPIGRGGDRALP
jgi:3',5'-cyclic AMP phosphodiesterase CpdA